MSRINFEAKAAVLKALAHPDRLAIVCGLMKNECNVGEIQDRLSLPQSTVSQHLRVLRDMGVIKGRKEGNRRCYRVVNDFARGIAEQLGKG